MGCVFSGTKKTTILNARLAFAAIGAAVENGATWGGDAAPTLEDMAVFRRASARASFDGNVVKLGKSIRLLGGHADSNI